MRSVIAISTLFAAFPGVAWAAFPDDVVLTELSTYGDEPITNLDATGGAYAIVIKQLAVGIANKPLSPAETLGINGFDVAVTSSVTFTDSYSDDADSPASWARVHSEEEPTRVLWVPGITVRKGLPLSLEVGFNTGYVSFSRQGVFGAYGRWGILEGYRNFPDVSIQAGYAGYIGNEQLDLGVMDTSASVGYTVPFGYLDGINNAQFSPYLGVGLLRINAAPLLSDETQEDLGISAVSGFKKKDSFTDGYTPLNFHLGFRLLAGDVQLLVSATAALKAAASVNVGFGYVF